MGPDVWLPAIFIFPFIPDTFLWLHFLSIGKSTVLGAFFAKNRQV